MSTWTKIKHYFGIVTVNDRLGIIESNLQDGVIELGRLRKKVKNPLKTRAQLERARSERRHPNRHH